MRYILAFLVCSLAMTVRADSQISLSGRATYLDPQSWQFEVVLDQSAPVRLTCVERGGLQERHLVDEPAAQVHYITVRGLKAGTLYVCFADLMDGSGERTRGVAVNTAPLPRDLEPPRIEVRSQRVAETGYTLFNYGELSRGFDLQSNYLVILDPDGNIRWYYGGVGGGDIDVSYIEDNKFLFGGWGGDNYAPTIIDIDKQIAFEATDALGSPFEVLGSYNHDVGMSIDGNSIFTLADTRIDSSWQGFVIKQIDFDNKVKWSWDSVLDGVAQGEFEEGSEERFDPYHPNAVFDRWEGGKLFLYVSLRNTNRIIKIDYQNRDVVWQLGVGGDFELFEPGGTPAEDWRWFFNQHDVKIYGDSIVMHDNGTMRHAYGGEDYSRLLILDVNQDRMTANIRFEYSEDGWVEPIWGGADLLPNGNILGALGHCWLYSNSRSSSIVEVNQEGEVVWRARFGDKKDAIYRAERIDGCEIFNNARYCAELE